MSTDPSAALPSSPHAVGAHGYAGDVTPEQALRWMETQEAVLVDVRTDAEREWVGRVPGANPVAWKQCGCRERYTAHGTQSGVRRAIAGGGAAGQEGRAAVPERGPFGRCGEAGDGTGAGGLQHPRRFRRGPGCTTPSQPHGWMAFSWSALDAGLTGRRHKDLRAGQAWRRVPLEVPEGIRARGCAVSGRGRSCRGS